jgi:prepilin-type N-terminal cleavage/methylation domain-containing protein
MWNLQDKSVLHHHKKNRIFSYFFSTTSLSSSSRVFTRGFTLIEMMVAFSIITTIGIGSLLSMNNAYKRSRSQRTAADSITFVLDSMARDIRTGYQYNCSVGTGPDCYTFDGSSTFSFIDQDARDVTYTLIGNRIERTITDTGVATNEFLTSPDIIDVTSLRFRMIGANTASQDPYQPFVVITLSGTASYAGHRTPISLQTSVTQRLLDIPTS